MKKDLSNLLKNKYYTIFSSILFLCFFVGVHAQSLPGQGTQTDSYGAVDYSGTALDPNYDVNQDTFRELRAQQAQEYLNQNRCQGICKNGCDEIYEKEGSSEIKCANNQKCCVSRCFDAGGDCKMGCLNDTEKVLNISCPNNLKCCSRIILSTKPEKSEFTFTPEIGIPGFKDKVIVDNSLLKKFLVALYNYLLYLSGIFAVMIFIIAGFQWVLAGGNESKIGEAKDRMKNAIIGLVLISSSYLILSIINKDLINIKDLDVPPVDPVAISSQYLESQCMIDGGLMVDDKTECGSCTVAMNIFGYFLDVIPINNKWCCVCRDNKGMPTCESGYAVPPRGSSCKDYCLDMGSPRFIQKVPSGCCGCVGAGGAGGDI